MAALSVRSALARHTLNRFSPAQLGCRATFFTIAPCLPSGSRCGEPANIFLLSGLQARAPQTKHRRHVCGGGVGGRMADGALEQERQREQDREVLVQHVLVKEDQLQLLIDIQRRLLEGEHFSVLASEHSICPSKSQGGMLGWIQKGRTVPEFDEAAFSAALDKIVRVKSKHGWHLLQVLEERPAGFLRQIEPNEFASKVKDTDVQLIDVREPNEIALAAVEGFKAYPLSQFGTWAPTITEDLDPAKDTYVMCHHGVRSMQAAQWLKSQGFRKLYNISGGIHAYSHQVDSSVPTY